MRKISPPLEFDPGTVQPVAIYYLKRRINYRIDLALNEWRLAALVNSKGDRVIGDRGLSLFVILLLLAGLTECRKSLSQEGRHQVKKFRTSHLPNKSRNYFSSSYRARNEDLWLAK